MRVELLLRIKKEKRCGGSKAIIRGRVFQTDMDREATVDSDERRTVKGVAIRRLSFLRVRLRGATVKRWEWS